MYYYAGARILVYDVNEKYKFCVCFNGAIFKIHQKVLPLEADLLYIDSDEKISTVNPNEGVMCVHMTCGCALLTLQHVGGAGWCKY